MEKENKNKHLTFEEYISKVESGWIRAKEEVYTPLELFKEYMEYIKK